MFRDFDVALSFIGNMTLLIFELRFVYIRYYMLSTAQFLQTLFWVSYFAFCCLDL